MQLNDSTVNGNLNVTEDVQIGDMSVTEELTKLNSNLDEIQTKTNGVHDFAESRISYAHDYPANSYIAFNTGIDNTDGVDNSLFNENIATFHGNGLVTINQDMRALINVNIVGATSNNDSRLWMSLNNYDTGKRYAQYIVCNTAFASGVISIILDLTAGTQLGLILYDSFKINKGLSGSYIQIMKL